MSPKIFGQNCVDVREATSWRRAHSGKKLHHPVQSLAQNMFVATGFVETIPGEGEAQLGTGVHAYHANDAGLAHKVEARLGWFRLESVWGNGRGAMEES